jgi:hypothetical protein
MIGLAARAGIEPREGGADPVGVRSLHPGDRPDQGCTRPGRKHDRAAGGQCSELGDVEDLFTLQLPVDRGALFAGRRRRAQQFLVTDDLAEPVEEGGFVDAAAADGAVRGGPELLHAALTPAADALGPGLQDRDEHGPAGAVVAVQVGQVFPPAHVRGLVEDADHRYRRRPPGQVVA